MKQISRLICALLGGHVWQLTKEPKRLTVTCSNCGFVSRGIGIETRT
jgi:hypothetical protein